MGVAVWRVPRTGHPQGRKLDGADLTLQKVDDRFLIILEGFEGGEVKLEQTGGSGPRRAKADTPLRHIYLSARALTIDGQTPLHVIRATSPLWLMAATFFTPCESWFIDTMQKL